MTKGQLVDKKKYDRHIELMNNVEAAALAASQNNSEYWWSLWLIYTEETWRAVTDDGKITTFLGDLSRTPFGPSVQTFYNRMGAIRHWFSMGMSEKKVKLMLGSRSETALNIDLNEWFNKDGELKPEVVKQIEAEHETPAKAIERIAELSPSEARKEVQRYVSKDSVFPYSDEAVYDERTGRLLFTLRWDNDDDGLMWLGTVTVSGKSTAPEDGAVLPEAVVRYLAKRLGLRLEH